MGRVLDKLGWIIAALVSLVALAAVAGLASAGPLDPPGPVGPTGKTVITSLPWTISQPGSYVLNSNLTCMACTNGQSGISVAADNVTIDLHGFELVGVAGAGSGVWPVIPGGHSYSPHRYVTVRNGTIRNWPQYGVRAEFGLHVEDLEVQSNGYGILGGWSSTVTDCVVRSSTLGFGIYLSGGEVNNCSSEGNAGLGIGVGSDGLITNVTTYLNGGTEIYSDGVVTLENCVANGGYVSNSGGNGIEVGENSVIRGCSALGNPGSGIIAGPGSMLEGCTAQDNFGTASMGIQVGDGSIVRGCTVGNNGGTEIYAGNETLIEDCVVYGWGGIARTAGNGIRVGSKSTVSGCIVTNNAANGILAEGTHNRLESNEVMHNSGWGIYLASVGNMIIGNRSQESTSGNCYDPGSNAFVKAFGPDYATINHAWLNLC